MGNVNPGKREIEAMLNLPEDQPVVMLNLLKFKDRTDEGKSGRRQYLRYQKAVKPLLEKAGGEAVWTGQVKNVLVSTIQWDAVLLVKYPSPKVFFEMVSSREYQEIAHLRESALEEAALIANHANQL